MVAFERQIKHSLQTEYETQIVENQPAEFCSSLQSVFTSEIGGKITQVLFHEFSSKLKIIGNNKYISSKAINDILQLLDDEYILRNLSRLTPKLKGIITDENAEFINSLMLDNKFSAEKIISELKKFLENYEFVLDVESNEIHKLAEYVFCYKNSQGSYHLACTDKNGRVVTLDGITNPSFKDIPKQLKNGVFSVIDASHHATLYLFKIPERVMNGEAGSYGVDPIKTHTQLFFEHLEKHGQIYTPNKDGEFVSPGNLSMQVPENSTHKRYESQILHNNSQLTPGKSRINLNHFSAPLRFSTFELATLGYNAQISELYFDEENKKSICDIKSKKHPSKYKSTPHTHELVIIDSRGGRFYPMLNECPNVARIELLNGVIIASDGEFTNPFDNIIQGEHFFYSPKGEPLLRIDGMLKTERLPSHLVSIENNEGKIIIEVNDGTIRQLNKNPINFYRADIVSVVKEGCLFWTKDGKIGSYNLKTKIFKYFLIPLIRDVTKINIYDHQDIIIGNQFYIFNNGELYKLKDEYIIKDDTIHERKLKYFSGKKLLSCESGFAEDMNYSWSQEELDTYFDEVQTTDA